MTLKRLAFLVFVIGCSLTIASSAHAGVNYQDYGFSQYVDDARWFEIWDGNPYDRNPYANKGFFFSFDMTQLAVESVEPATIGSDSAVPRQVFIGTLQSLTEFNALTTGAFKAAWHNGNDTTFGYIEDQHGWFVRWFDMKGRDLELVRSNVGVTFEDPQGLLLGFFDGDGDGQDDSIDGDLNFGRDGGLLDAGDLVLQGVVFREMSVRQATKIWTFEVNYIHRFDRELCGAYWETFCGLRFMSFNESFDVSGRGSVLSNSFWNTEADNRLIGPQVGIRWFRTDGRWTFSCDSRAMAAINFQNLNQTISFGDNLSQIAGGGTDLSSVNTNLFRSRFAQFAPRESVNAEHEMELAPLVEMSAQATFHLTRKISFRAGVRGLVVDGIARPSAMINYSFPDVGFVTNNNYQRVYMFGGFVGFEVNR